LLLRRVIHTSASHTGSYESFNRFTSFTAPGPGPLLRSNRRRYAHGRKRKAEPAVSSASTQLARLPSEARTLDLAWAPPARAVVDVVEPALGPFPADASPGPALGAAVELGAVAVLLDASVSAWPRVGKGRLGFTAHPPAVDEGHGRGVTDAAEYADNGTLLGLTAAHCDLRLEKSGRTGVGVP
jgi:hypothetical protein